MGAQQTFPENGTKAEQIKWFDQNDDDLNEAKAIAFCVGASPSYAQKVLSE